MNTRVEITHYNKVAFVGEFASFNAAQDFHAWWTNQSALPQGGATIARADKPDNWRATHPLGRMDLTRAQGRLIANQTAGGRGFGPDLHKGSQ